MTDRKNRAKKMMAVLKKLFPQAGIMLHYSNNFELLVAVMLSAQCTDKKVNEVTETLFKKYKTLNDYIKAPIKTFEQDIRQTGFYKNKAKNILASALMVKKNWNGLLPRAMDELIQLPGVARKTANVVLGNAHGIVEGIAVDTHVRRMAIKFNLSTSTDPKKIEQDLMIIIPQKDWFTFTYLAIEYGRRICPGRKHACDDHPLSHIYPPAAKHFPRSR